jgi:hypothetical protein
VPGLEGSSFGAVCVCVALLRAPSGLRALLAESDEFDLVALFGNDHVRLRRMLRRPLWFVEGVNACEFEAVVFLFWWHGLTSPVIVAQKKSPPGLLRAGWVGALDG